MAPDNQDTLIWGINAVREALARQGQPALSDVWIQKGKGGRRLQAIIDQARALGIRVRFTELGHLVGRCHHQGVAARMALVPLLPFEAFLERAAASKRVLALDCIQDPRNLGAILRSAWAAGFDPVLLSRERSAPLTGTVVQSSAGAASHLHLCQVTNMANGLKQLQQTGFWIYGAVASSAGRVLYEQNLDGRVVVVIGNEGRGIRRLIKKQCDHLVTIPMVPGVESLNASVAAGIILFEVVRQQGEWR